MTPLPRLRTTLIDRYIIREILPPFGLGLLLFTFILLLQQITILTGVLISRSADFGTVLRVFANLLPSIFSVTIPMAFLLGVLLAFGRLASESEIIALRASGVSPAAMLRPVLLLSAAASLVTFYVMAYALPYANQSYRQIMFSLVVNKARSAIKPRVFADDLLPGSQMVLYVSDIPAASGRWNNVFIHDAREPREPAVILARRGQLVIDEKRRSVVMYLQEGSRYTWSPADPAQARRLSFTDQVLPLPEDAIFPQISLTKGDREMTIADLAERIRELEAKGKPDQARNFWVELHKKFAIPLACVVFGLLGLGLSLGGKKEARSAAFGLSIAVIFVYYVLIRLGEQAGDTGKMPPLIAVWGANLVMGAIAVVLLVLNHREAAFDPLDIERYRLRLRFRRRPATPARPAPSPPGTRQQPVVVVRIPRPSFRILALLDRYIARTYLALLALVTTAFTSIYVLVEFLDLYDDVIQHHVKGALVLHYYLYHVPFIVHLMSFVAVLVTALATLGVLARRNEITAMKAAGVSIYRVCLPVIVLGLLGGGLLFGMAEFLLPYTNRVAARDFNVIKGRPPQSSSYFERRWILGRDARFYYYDYLQEGQASGSAPAQARDDGVTLFGLSAFDVDPRSWELREHLYANRALWNGVAYDLQEGWRRQYRPRTSMKRFDETRSREIEGPAYFRREEKDSDSLRFGELRDQIRTLEARGLDVIKLRVQLQRKLAFPLVAVVMTLLGIPFAFVVARRGALYGIGVSIVIAIVYWTAFMIFEHLGNNGLLPPLLAAWAPNLIFATIGLYLFLNLDT